MNFETRYDLSRRGRYAGRLLFLITMAALILNPGAAAQGRFDYADLRGGLFTPKTVGGVRSMRDGEHYTAVDSGRIVRYSYRTGERLAVIFDRATATPSIDFTDYRFSADETRILLSTDVKPVYRRSFTAEYWIFDTKDGSLRRLSTGGPQQQAAFSPDGHRVAFVRDNDLFVADLADGAERRITSDGRKNHIINGIPDWVYEEEFAFARAFEWSPDGRRIAWLRFDESRVREYNMNRFDGKLYPENYTFKYPKAGEENSIVELYCHDLETGETVRIDTGGETDRYIPRLLWTPSGELAFYRLNRLQNHFEVLLSDRNGARRLRRTRRTLRRTCRPVDRHVPARRRPFRRPQRTERLHAPVLAQHPQRLSETTDRRTVGSHGDAGRLRRPGLLLVHRNLAAQTRPVCGPTGRQG